MAKEIPRRRTGDTPMDDTATSGQNESQIEPPPNDPCDNLCISPNPPHTLVHILCTKVRHEDVAAVGSAKAEARKREGGSYLSAVLSTVLTVLAQSAAAVALAEAESLA